MGVGSVDTDVDLCSSVGVGEAAQSGLVDDSLDGALGTFGGDDYFCQCCLHFHAELFRTV